eukprot:scaffold136368_cov17-Tisochrysis_lutea.AAC.1
MAQHYVTPAVQTNIYDQDSILHASGLQNNAQQQLFITMNQWCRIHTGRRQPPNPPPKAPSPTKGYQLGRLDLAVAPILEQPTGHTHAHVVQPSNLATELNSHPRCSLLVLPTDPFFIYLNLQGDGNRAQAEEPD